jgi:PAS domain S-box-containing protein
MATRAKQTIDRVGKIAWSLLEARAEGVVLVDTDGIILFANEVAAKRFSKSVKAMVGTSIWDLNRSSHINHLKILFNQAIQSREPMTTNQQEGDHWSRTMIYPIQNRAGEVERVALCSWDITSEINAQEKYKITALELITAQEEERHRISRDLHDDIGQRMTALALNLHSIETSLESSRPISVEEVKNAIHDLETITKQTRQIFYQLHPPSLGTVAFPKVLEAFCASFEYTAGVSVDFNCQMDLPELNDLQTTVLYRFVQEGFANIAKHAAASRVWISLDYIDRDINISIEDDGKGFDPKNIQEGLGLRGIRERFQILNGSVEIESTPGKGTHLFGTLPYEQKEV